MAGNCCLRHPFSPVLEPCQGGDICSLAGLTWPHVIMLATMSSLQYRHGAPPRQGAMCQRPPSSGCYPVSGFLSEPSQDISCPLLPTTWSCVFIAHHNIIKSTYHVAVLYSSLFASSSGQSNAISAGFHY